MNNPQDLLESLVAALVSDPQTVDIVATTTPQSVIYSIWVPERDRGKIIGARGSIIESLKTLMNAVGRKNGTAIILEIDE